MVRDAFGGGLPPLPDAPRGTRRSTATVHRQGSWRNIRYLRSGTRDSNATQAQIAGESCELPATTLPADSAQLRGETSDDAAGPGKVARRSERTQAARVVGALAIGALERGDTKQAHSLFLAAAAVLANDANT